MPKAHPMLRVGTPIEDHCERFGLFVKREDLACFPPGPPFSKTRGVYAHIAKLPHPMVGVLDTSHSQAGHAVARACEVLGKDCVNYFPRYNADPEGVFRKPQIESMKLGAQLVPLKAGRSCILYHQAKKHCQEAGGYMMPNALKLDESVEETAKEVPRTGVYETVILPASSGTIAAGVIRGFCDPEQRGSLYADPPRFVVHLGYSRSHDEVRRYLEAASGYRLGDQVKIIDEGYAYKDKAKLGPTPPWPCNEFYDLKAVRWWMDVRPAYRGRTLLWNIG